jgi:hypothetical protein
MDPDDSHETAEKARRKRPGRIRSALRALAGQSVMPDQVRAEWVAWQYEFEAILDKLSAAAARQVTRDKRDLKKALKRLKELESEKDCGCGGGAAVAPAVSGSYSPEKRLLNRRILASRGITVPDLTPQNGAGYEHGAESEQE